MTIQLHWWFVPAVLLVAAVIIFIGAQRDSDSRFDVMLEAFSAIALVLMAAMFLLGHYL